jgi:glutamate-1-semialdehyde 2,1-aminomutase
MSAGFTLLSELHANPEVYTGLAKRGASLADGIRDVMTEKSIPHQVNQVGSMLSLHLCESPVVDFETAKAGDNAHFKALFHHMLDAGIYLPPSAYESWFLCSLIDDTAQDQTLSALRSFSLG